VWRGRQFVERLTQSNCYFNGKFGAAVTKALFYMETRSRLGC
jgi:hypothetical protein